MRVMFSKSRRRSVQRRWAVVVLAATSVVAGLPLLPWAFTGTAEAAAQPAGPGTADLAAKVGDRAGSAVAPQAGSGKGGGPQEKGANPPEGPQGAAELPKPPPPTS